MKRFYVTMTWDDFPEGGSFGDVIEAETHEQAEAFCRRHMAATRTEGAEVLTYADDLGNGWRYSLDGDEGDGTFESEDAALEAGYAAAEQKCLDEYGDEWNVIDCFDLDQFIAQHASPVHKAAPKMLAALKAMDDWHFLKAVGNDIEPVRLMREAIAEAEQPEQGAFLT